MATVIASKRKQNGGVAIRGENPKVIVVERHSKWSGHTHAIVENEKQLREVKKEDLRIYGKPNKVLGQHTVVRRVPASFTGERFIVIQVCYRTVRYKGKPWSLRENFIPTSSLEMPPRGDMNVVDEQYLCEKDLLSREAALARCAKDNIKAFNHRQPVEQWHFVAEVGRAVDSEICSSEFKSDSEIGHIKWCESRVLKVVHPTAAEIKLFSKPLTKASEMAIA